MTALFFLGQVCLWLKHKLIATACCITTLPAVLQKYKRLRRNQFSRKAAWFCAWNTKI